MITGRRQSLLPAGGRATFRSKGLVLLGTLLILSSMFAFVASRPASALASGDPSESTIVVSDASPVAGSSVDVTVTTFDGGFQAYDYTDVIVITATLVDAPYTPTILTHVDNGDGTYTSSLSDTVAQAYTVSATINSSPITTGDATVTFVPGPADATQSMVESAPATINVDIGSSVVTVTSKDQYGNVRTAGGDAVARAGGGGGSLTSFVDAGGGAYTATLTDTVTHIDTVSVTVNAVAITADAIVDFTPGALTHFHIDTIGGQTAGSSFLVTVTAHDQFHNVKTDYAGGATLSGLANSPGCTGCLPVLAAAAPTYGTLTFVNGVATTSVTAVDADGVAKLTVTDGSIDDDSAAFVVTHAATVAGFTFGTQPGPTQTANAAFGFAITAYDAYGNDKADNNAGTLSGLATSPGCAIESPAGAGNGCATAIAGTAPIYGSILWSGGTGTVTGVKAFNAQTGANVTITLGAASRMSNTFTVNAIAANRVFFDYPSFSFDGRPIDTEISGKIYHVCNPSGSSVGDPCLNTSAPVQVLAIDQYGNRAASAQSIGITINGVGLIAPIAAFANGVASFGAQLPAPAVAGTVTLVGSATSAGSTTRTIQAVNDLEACVGTTCDNVAANTGASQTAFGKIFKSLNLFGGGNTVTLTTQFISNLGNGDLNRCANPQNSPLLGQMTEVKVQGGGVSATAPNFTMVLSYPKKTLQDQGFTSRGTDKFNVCLGATVLSLTQAGPGNTTVPTVPWKAMTSLTNSTLVDATRPVGVTGPLKIGDTYWGWVPMCTALTANQKLTNPCISIKTKQVAALKTQLVSSGVMLATEFDAYATAAKLKDSDEMIAISKPWPWDGKGIVR